MCCYPCTFFFVEYSSDKRSKEIGPSSLKDSGERVVLILFFCSTDLPHWFTLIFSSTPQLFLPRSRFVLYFIIYYCFPFIFLLLPTFFLFSIILTGGLKNRGLLSSLYCSLFWYDSVSFIVKKNILKSYQLFTIDYSSFTITYLTKTKAENNDAQFYI